MTASIFLSGFPSVKTTEIASVVSQGIGLVQ